jgi:hypothetical protein
MGGTPRAVKSNAPRDPSPVSFSPSVAGKKESPVTVAVAEFLDELRLDGSERVLGALAIALAGNFEAAPLYAQSNRQGASVLHQMEKERRAGVASRLPAASIARTRNEWLPCLSPP